ncbi:MAG TPA: sugar ABC transporter substrate-binding protein [Gammaproteobacteria bacterium]|nr:sugar ABC transporter substrate-binding protein [Gammaproteobacteria bacterium]
MRSFSFIHVLLLILLTSLAGCESTGSAPGKVSAGNTAIVDDAVAAAYRNAKEYRIGVDDEVKVSVWKNPDLSVTVPVRPDGNISVPLIGDVRVGGKTPTEVASLIKDKLSVYLRDPQVTVMMTKLESDEFLSRIRITGAVNKPKSLQYRQGMTILDAVLEAGGVSKFANADATKLYRKDQGKRKVYRVRLKRILKKGDLGTNYQLLPGDVITVPERAF